ncbi:MAG TPA: stage II sporulation protein R [Ruminococcus sp.]|nr:stage II sporulation protein R [Ruminococcus sp.]
MRKFEFSAVLGLILALCWGNVAHFEQKLNDLQNGVLRLHILANSDSDRDQQLKLLVRDELLKQSEMLFSGCNTLDEMKERAVQQKETIRLIAQSVLEKNGCDDRVTVQLTEMEFDKREYEEITMPAGAYEALRILIGEGEGHNWWCVMYPPLCLPVASDPSEWFDGETVEILTQPEKYEVKFKCVEIWHELQEKLSE